MLGPDQQEADLSTHVPLDPHNPFSERDLRRVRRQPASNGCALRPRSGCRSLAHALEPLARSIRSTCGVNSPPVLRRS